jgi:uncharacterized membrane protein HdeD (DUF308 family)
MARIARTHTTIETFAARGTMVAVALGVIALGITVLTSPLAVPLTLGLWLGAAGLVFLGLFGTLPE